MRLHVKSVKPTVMTGSEQPTVVTGSEQNVLRRLEILVLVRTLSHTPSILKFETKGNSLPE